MTKLLSLLVAISFVGCAHKQVYKDTNAWNEGPEKSLQLVVKGAKFKGKKVDLNYAIKNNYPFTVVVREGSVSLSANGETGSSNGGPRLELRPGQIVSQRVIVLFEEKVEGSLKLSLSTVYRGEEYTKDVSVSGGSIGVQPGMDRTSASTIGFGHASTGIKVKGALDGEALPGVSVDFVRD